MKRDGMEQKKTSWLTDISVEVGGVEEPIWESIWWCRIWMICYFEQNIPHLVRYFSTEQPRFYSLLHFCFAFNCVTVISFGCLSYSYFRKMTSVLVLFVRSDGSGIQGCRLNFPFGDELRCNIRYDSTSLPPPCSPHSLWHEYGIRFHE